MSTSVNDLPICTPTAQHSTTLSLVLGLTLTVLAGCHQNPFATHTTATPADDLNGQSIIVMGYSAEMAVPYQGGMLHTGHVIDTVNGHRLDPPFLLKGDSLMLPPGEHLLEGVCFWQLRGTFNFPDDLQERGQLLLVTRPNHRYTIQSTIDEYKARCDLRFLETPPQAP